jgi:hypothetical protein
MLHDTGVEIGKILGAIPGLPGALVSDHLGAFIQLRITLSASELAMLPFELAKAPVSATTTAESWLSIQTRPPVCITRNIRTVSPEGVVWPVQPRILFISGTKRTSRTRNTRRRSWPPSSHFNIQVSTSSLPTPTASNTASF